MSFIKISLTILAISMFLSACTSSQPQQTVSTDPIINNVPQNGDLDDYWAKDNLDLQRVGNLFERPNSPEEFESCLNAKDGINKLDLNGDGYVDYSCVQEYMYILGDNGEVTYDYTPGWFTSARVDSMTLTWHDPGNIYGAGTDGQYGGDHVLTASDMGHG